MLASWVRVLHYIGKAHVRGRNASLMELVGDKSVPVAVMFANMNSQRQVEEHEG